MAQWDLADSYTLTNGTWITGTVEDTWTENLTYLQIKEDGGAEGLVFSFTFLNIPDWVQWIDVDIIGRYEGNPAHVIKIRVWDFNLTQWDNITTAANDFPSGDVDIKRDFQIEDPQSNDYLQNGEMRIQIYHPDSGNPNHEFYVDKIYLEPYYIEELLGKFDVGQGSAELLGKIFVRQGSAELLGKFEVGQDSAELLGNFEAQATADLLGKFEAQATVELLGNAIIRHSDTAELLGKVVIRHTGTPRELVARCIIRHSASKDLDANVIVNHWQDMYGKSVIRHTATPLNLPAIFWARWPTRLWTSRRYINGVIELDEKLLGDASLEYVIEGVMEDTQGYLDNAGLPYSDWTNLTLVPVQILRAVTYGTVAALYARHTQTFRGQVIPSITPVTVTVIGDAEKAMNYWEERTDQMLEFYVTSQGGDVMLTSTPDEEPVFSMEDIPEEVTEYVSWRVWLQQRGES
jgi:hypothetical protein